MGRSIRQRFSDAKRAWIAGPGVVLPHESASGHDDSTYSPGEYGDYLVTSNPIYTCATIRADAMSMVDWNGINLVNGKHVPNPASPEVALLKYVNEFWTLRRLVRMVELSLCLWGKSPLAVERGESGKDTPREIWWMKPDRVFVIPDERNYIKGFAYAPVNGGDPIAFAPSEVIWLRYPNPLDEFGALSPMSAARLAADTATSAGRSNKKLFDNGWQLGGIVTPKNGVEITTEQATELEKQLDSRFKGVDKAHRWGVFRIEAEMKEMGVTPKDAEFLGALNWSLEEAARAYKIPLDMLGGQRTYENVKASDRALWMRAMMPEALFLADEFTEQFLPMFPKRTVQVIEPGFSHVMALQDDEETQWKREQGQIQVGAIKINEWRASKGLDPVPWGESPMGQNSNAPVATDEAMDEPLPGDQAPVEQVPAGQNQPRSAHRGIEYGSDDHRRIMAQYERKMSKWEKPIRAKVEELFKRQRDSILDKLKAAGDVQRTRISAEDLFAMAKWVKIFRLEMRPVLRDIVGDSGSAAIDDLGLSLVFDLSRPEVLRFLEQRAQRFATEVNATTWDALKASLGEGLDIGEGLEDLMARVTTEMGDRIESSAETIARTEALGASNGGSLEAWRQSGADPKKAWLSALQPGRTRETHMEAHQRYQAEPIGLDEDFEVGDGAGPHPGAIGLPEEDINCLCTMVPVLD